MSTRKNKPLLAEKYIQVYTLQLFYVIRLHCINILTHFILTPLNYGTAYIINTLIVKENKNSKTNPQKSILRENCD